MGSKGQEAITIAARSISPHSTCTGCVSRPGKILCSARAHRSGTFQVELTATNPLNCRLTLSDMRVSLTGTEDIFSDSVDHIELEPYECRVLSIPITMTNPGNYTLKSVHFSFNRFFPYEQSLARKGRRLHATKQHRIQPTYADDTTLTISIEPSRPMATVSLEAPPYRVYDGEELSMILHIRNTGTVPFEQVQLYPEGVSSIRLKAGRFSSAWYRTQWPEMRTHHDCRYPRR